MNIPSLRMMYRPLPYTKAQVAYLSIIEDVRYGGPDANPYRGLWHLNKNILPNLSGEEEEVTDGMLKHTDAARPVLCMYVRESKRHLSDCHYNQILSFSLSLSF